MTRVNPLYIALLLIFLLGFSLVKLAQAKQESVRTKQELLKSEELATTLRAMQNVYEMKKTQQVSLNQLVNVINKSDAILQKTETKSSVVLTSEKIQLKQLDTLMAKIFNNPYKINRLKIEKISENNARLHLEILW